MSGTAGFDPEDTRADPTTIREQAQGFRRIGGGLTGRQSSLTFILRSLASSFSEVLHPVIGARIGEQFDTVQRLVGAMLYAEQVADGWADDVAAFQRRRAELIRGWESAQRNGFWVTRAPGYGNVEPEMRETLYDDARRILLRDLNAEADAAYATLSLAAEDRGRQFCEGPTTGNLLSLIDAGLASGPGLALLYPYLEVPGPRSGLPRQYWGLSARQLVLATEEDPELAGLLASRRPGMSAGSPFEAALARAVLISAGDSSVGSAYGAASAARVTEVAQIVAGIPPEELALLSALFPAVVGNLDGMPFANRIAAHRINVAAALHQARRDYAGAATDAGDAGPPPVGYEGGVDPSAEAARTRAADLDVRITQYERLLTETTVDYGAGAGPPWPVYRGRKLLYFDPTGDGAWAELVGTIDADTEDVGILVPGVGVDAPDMSGKSDEATEFVAQAARNGDQLAMVVWAGGDFPDGIASALSATYADNLAAPLVDFSYALQDEIDGRDGRRHAAVTVIGHSYGGLTLARATRLGLSADRLLFVNSPGLNPGEAAHLPAYDVYAMDAPGDPVAAFGPLIYGRAPVEYPGVIDLETGSYRDGTTIAGIPGHAGVFQVSSGAWENMLAVLTGRPYRVVRCS